MTALRLPAKGPVVFAIRFSDWHLVDAGVPMRHQSILGEEPVLVPVSAEPLPTVVVVFIGITHRDAVVCKGPQLLDEPVFVFLVPLAGQESLGLFSIGREFDPVTPARIECIGQSDLRRIARVPAIFGQANLFDGSFSGERGSGGRVMMFPFVI